jgi:hypothetical protein
MKINSTKNVQMEIALNKRPQFIVWAAQLPATITSLKCATDQNCKKNLSAK